MLDDATLITRLREWAAAATSFRVADYDGWARSHDAPSPSTLIQRFGSWSSALREAGLEDRLTSERQSRPVTSDAELWACIVAYLRADRDRHSFADLGVWLRGEGLPSAASMRARLGKWSEIRAVAQSVIDGEAPADFAGAVLAITPGAGPRREFDDAACRAALRRVAQVVDSMTMEHYDAAREPHEPSADFLMRRYSGWRAALAWAEVG